MICRIIVPSSDAQEWTLMAVPGSGGLLLFSFLSNELVLTSFLCPSFKKKVFFVSLRQMQLHNELPSPADRPLSFSVSYPLLQTDLLA